jgi:arylsulfatase A-like enzyme
VDAQTDVMLEYLARRAEIPDTPFLCFHSYLEPHHQNTDDSYPAPDGYAELYRHAPFPPDLQALGGSAPEHWAGYCGMIKRLDEALGRTLDLLKSTSLDRNTVVVYISDHGCHFKTRNAEYKRSPHESSVRVPMVFRGPGWNGGGERREAVSLVDLMPTLLDCAGVTVPDGVQGRSMRSLTVPGAEWEEDAFIQFGDGWLPPGRALRSSRWKYAVTAAEAHAGTACAPEYVETHLYDLRADPYELRNLVASEVHDSVRKRLRGRLLDRMAACGEPPAEILPVPAGPSGQRTVEYPS